MKSGTQLPSAGPVNVTPGVDAKDDDLVAGVVDSVPRS
jgi:hypothetical protein